MSAFLSLIRLRDAFRGRGRFSASRRALWAIFIVKVTIIGIGLTLAPSARAADPTVMVPVMVDTNLNLGVGYINFFQQNSVPLNLAVSGANTNLSGLALASGTATLSNGTNLVSTPWCWTTNRFTFGYRALDGSQSVVSWKSATNGVSFTIYSGNATDTNLVDWVITKP